MSADLAELLYQLALAHLGIARIPEFMVVDEVRRGVLVPLLQEYAFPEPIYAIYRSRRQLSARIRSFINFLADAVKDADWNLDRAQPAKLG